MPVALLETSPERARPFICRDPARRHDQPASRSRRARQDPGRFRPGRVLHDRYVIERELGRGGMGQVHLARSPDGAPVAIKVVIPPKQGGLGDSFEDQLQEALAEEARLGTNLRHRAITLVYDHAVDEIFPYTVLEYIDGPSLRDQLRDSTGFRSARSGGSSARLPRGSTMPTTEA